MTEGIRRIVKSPFFERFILGVILLAAVLVGMETYPGLVAGHGDTLHAFNEIVLWIFVAEAILKMAQYGAGFLRYFRDPWNAFDFSIVAICSCRSAARTSPCCGWRESRERCGS